jgi:hypothetical protein
MPLLGAGSGGLDPRRAERVIRAELERQRHRFDRLELVVRGR